MKIVCSPGFERSFTLVPNTAINDSRLSFCALGALAYLLSLQPGQEVKQIDADVISDLGAAGYIRLQDGGIAVMSAELPAPEPVNKKTAEAAQPADVSDEVWQDFKRLRKLKKAPITNTALAGIRRQADLAGWSLEQALRECCQRGWQGFNADWVASRETTYAKSMRERYQQAAPAAAVRMPTARTIDPNTYFTQLEVSDAAQ